MRKLLREEREGGPITGRHIVSWDRRYEAAIGKNNV